MEQDQRSESTESADAELGVRYVGLNDVPAQYANVISITFDGSVFQLVFGQVMPPIILGQQDRDELMAQGFVPARPVARLILTPEMLEQILETLNSQWTQHQQRSQEPKQEMTHD